MKTSTIIPAVMPEQFEDIRDLSALVKNRAQIIQLDIMDGKYVPERTWPFYHNRDRDFYALVNEEGYLPYWDELDYECDLMIARPEEHIDLWLQCGASRLVFHYASVHDWNPILSIDHGIRNFIQIGLAVTIHDDLDKTKKLLETGSFDYIQVMGIAHIGYQGESFEVASLSIIAEIHTVFPELPIQVDGGVSLETIAKMKEAGASCFVSGSGVFGQGIVDENIHFLESAVVDESV
jgi:ribulose-phosphate 3-epimerase